MELVGRLTICIIGHTERIQNAKKTLVQSSLMCLDDFEHEAHQHSRSVPAFKINLLRQTLSTHGSSNVSRDLLDRRHRNRDSGHMRCDKNIWMIPKRMRGWKWFDRTDVQRCCF